MLGQKIEWNEAKRLYERGIITKIELSRCAIDYINEKNVPETRNEAYIRACEVDVFMEGI